MSSSIPIIILSFNRPDLLEAVLVSLTQQGRPIDPKNVYLFQDGGSDLENECLDVFKKIIPAGTVMASDTNLGIALNFDRAERFAFESLGAEVAYFFEDDLVLGEHYLQVMDQLSAFALSEPRVGYFAAYGNHLAGLDEQKARSTEVVEMNHHWGFGLTKRQWARQREIIEPYLDIVRRDTYRRRDIQAIWDYYKKLGVESQHTSQDKTKELAGLVLGTTKIMSFACFARYEGKEGFHFKTEVYEKMGYGETQLLPELPTLVMPSSAVLDRWIEAGRRHAKFRISEEHPKPESKPMNPWYPSVVNVSPEGTPGTYSFMSKTFTRAQHFSYAEFGFYRADTARHVCELFPNATLHLFDFHENMAAAKKKLAAFPNRIFFYGNSQKFNDSYNWSLMRLLGDQLSTPVFDYCFLDGAHTVAIDALTFFLCDKLLKVGGFMDFDDYNWQLRGSSLDPSKIPAIADQYTDEQIDCKQVALIVDVLVKPDRRYKEVIPNKIYQKIS
jgi:hypothetical protein